MKSIIKKWRNLSKLDCVKEFGIGHKIAHMLNIHMMSRCMCVIGNIKRKG